MAQAARLNLRMQKEIKLLLTDPPPGATFPFLSPQSDSDSSSPSSSSSSSGFTLTSIDAQIQGPEGSVYEKGVFKLKIQIPERYPFQPPIVMFSTPIYHPNIDNGGRICLDILNLPPKGAWQPSLNISTVMTSIGLLLSEPNPDDGLMQEASREYKYNRQAFDHKARSMTEKYARAVSVEMARETPSELTKDPAENLESMIPIKPVCEDFINLKRMHEVSKKLSLMASDPSNPEKADRKEVNHGFELPTKKKIKGLLKESDLTLTEHNQTDNNLQCTKKKLQLGSKPVGKGDSLTEGKPDQYSPPPHCEPEADLENSAKCFSLGKNEFRSQQNLCRSEHHHLSTSTSIIDYEHSIQISEKDDKKLSLHRNIPPPEAASICADEEGRNRFTGIRNKKLGLTGRRLPLEKLVSNQTSFKRNDKELETKECDEKLVGSTENQEQASPRLDTVVVLDSEEESEEDEKVVPARSKLLTLARRRLPGKRKS